MYQNNIGIALSSTEERLVQDRLREVLSTIHYPHYSLRKRATWLAVPVASADHFDNSAIDRIANILLAVGDTRLIAVLLEPLINTPTSLAFPATREGIEAFDAECALFSYALFSPSLQWLVICTKEDYYLVVGHNTLVANLLGKKIRQAFDDFYSFVKSMSELEEIERSLQYVYIKAQEYNTAQEDEALDF